MYDPAKVAQAFSKLFQTYPSFQAGAADDALRVYFEAVEPYETGDILEAVTAFLNGSVPGTNANFAPPAPVFAGECRRQMNIRLRRDELDRAYRPKLPPPDVEHTPDGRARMLALATKAIANLTAVGGEEDADRSAKARERAEAELKRRVETGEMICISGAPFPLSQTLAKQLGYSVGDADGERDVA